MKPLENEISSELVGLHALNFSFGNDSSARSVMFASHFSQRLINDKSDQKIIQTGLEYELAKYTFDIKMPEDGVILKIIERYPSNITVDNIAFNPETIVIYEDNHTKELGYFSIPHHLSHHQHFGYRLVFTEAISSLIPGQQISKGTVFAHSPSVADNGSFKYGNNFNVAFMSHPAVSEDGILISESAINKLEFSIFETRVVEFGSGHYPLNIYGTLSNYKAFPEIGEEIREDGILMMLRKADVNMSPVDLSVYDTMEPDMIFDTAYYARGPKGVITDIKVYKDDNAASSLPDNMTSNIQKYVKALRNYHNEIVMTEAMLRKTRISKYGRDNLSISPTLHRLLVESLAILNKTSKKYTQKLNLLYRKAQLNEYRVVFTIEYRVKPTIGFKASDIHGGASVCIS